MILPTNEIHVWLAPASAVTQEGLEQCWKYLSEDEKQRASRYRALAPKNEFVWARGVLRKLLGDFLGIHPRDVHLRLGPHGKPELSPDHHADIEFNLSHSRGLSENKTLRQSPGGAAVALAFAQNIALGIDLEPISSSEPDASLLSAILTPNEIEIYHALEPHLKPPAFARAWAPWTYFQDMHAHWERPLG
ncbi:MAG: hypothetical protein NTX50_32405, partial [Candidatus Sumerlaeota bacterium]|nr:hypothetical protein [Candidatus Sumerlaeota bacterium]